MRPSSLWSFPSPPFFPLLFPFSFFFRSNFRMGPIPVFGIEKTFTSHPTIRAKRIFSVDLSIGCAELFVRFDSLLVFVLPAISLQVGRRCWKSKSPILSDFYFYFDAYNWRVRLCIFFYSFLFWFFFFFSFSFFPPSPSRIDLFVQKFGFSLFDRVLFSFFFFFIGDIFDEYEIARAIVAFLNYRGNRIDNRKIKFHSSRDLNLRIVDGRERVFFSLIKEQISGTNTEDKYIIFSILFPLRVSFWFNQ